MDTNIKDPFITEELERLKAAGLKRELKTIEGPQGPRALIDGRELVVLCSNDYLGLADHPGVKAAAIEAIERSGFGAGASRLVSGNMGPHVELEERIRAFKGSGAALLFNSGYNANLSVISTLAGRDTEIFSDKLNHASIVDAALLSRARVTRYRHADAGSLERALKGSSAKRRLVVTEGVFSMDGDIAPLADILALTDKYGATLVLDDAHATGVLGPGGRGTLAHLGLAHPDVIEVATLGKAFGAFGAFASCSPECKELLITRARSFVYTTALPPAVAAAATKAIDIAVEADTARQRLAGNAQRLRNGLNAAGLDTLGSVTHIIPVLVGGPEKTMEASQRLLEKGFFIQGIRPPTVPPGTGRLRVTITAGHTDEDLSAALSAIVEVFSGMGLSGHA